MARNSTNREVSIYINDREVINSLGGITRAISQTRNEMNSLVRGSATYDQDMQRLGNTLSDLTERQSQFREEIAQTAGVSNAASEALSNLFVGLTTGNMQMAQTGLMAIRGSIIATTQSALAFIATPIGATIAVLAGIALATKAWFDYNMEARETNKVLAGLTKQTGDTLDAIRVRTAAITEVFGKSMEETVGAANVLVNEFGLTFEEALSEIEQGLVKGGSANKEYLESLSEYATFFAQAGYSVEDFRSVVQAGFDLGIYQDKLPDAIKEFTLSITEQTKASRDALNNAFGEEFTNKLFKGVKDGSISAKEALEEISKEAEKIGLNSQQAQQLTADLFRGAGEDAGGALKIFNAVNQSFADQDRELTALEQSTKDLYEAQLELGTAQDNLLKSDGFETWKNGWDLAIVKLKTGFYQLISSIVNTKEEMKKLAEDDATAKNNEYLKKEYAKMYDEFLAREQKYSKDRIDIAEVTATKIAQIEAAMKNIKDKDILENYQLEIDTYKKLSAAKIAAQNVSTKASQEEIDAQKKADAERKKLADKRAKEEEDARKKREEQAKAVLEAQIRVAKAELNYFIALNGSKLDAEKKLTQELVDEETRRLALIHDKRDTALAEQRLRDIEKAEADAKSAEELVLLKQTIDLEYLTAKQNLDLEFQKSTDELKKQYEEEQKQLKIEQLQLDNELALEEAATKEEEDAIKRQQDYDKRIKELQEFKAKGKITEEEYNRFVIALDKKKAETERLAQLQSIDDKLKDIGRLADATVAIFGQNKAAASAQALINGGLAVTEILRQQSELPAVASAIFKGIQIAGVASTTLKSIAQINSAKAPKRAQFYYGGDTGNSPSLGYDQFGPVTGVVHSNEWVAPATMTQSPRYAATFSWLENERKGIMKRGFVDGGQTSTGTVAPFVETTTQTNDELLSIMKSVLFRLDNPIPPKMLVGYKEAEDIEKLNIERNQSADNGRISTP